MRVSEIFGGVNQAISNSEIHQQSPVIQGEGVRVGVPSIFLRLFGCNLRCPHFGIESTTVKNNPEVDEIISNIHQYESINELPIVKTGCDTFYAVWPQFKRFAHDLTVDQVYDNIISRCHPHNSNVSQPDLVITGGEPLLYQKQLIELFTNTALLSTIKNITFETNGTQELSKEFKSCINSHPTVNWVFSVSPKLSCSGHTINETLNTHAVKSYDLKNTQVYLKFVIHFDDNSETYKQEVQQFINLYLHEQARIDQVCIMPQGTTYNDTYINNAKQCVDWCCRMGYRYSPRLQVELFGNGVGT